VIYVQARAATREVVGFGTFQPTDPDPTMVIVQVADSMRTLLEQPGTKTIDDQGVITVTPLPAPPIVRQADLPIGATVTTNGTTPAELIRVTIPQHTELDVTVRINAVSRDETQVRKVVADATFGRVTGAPVQIGATTQLVLNQTAGAAGWTSTVAISGNDIVVTVTGSGALVVDWSIRGVGYRFGQAGLP
jgi:hypothetical protein